MFITVKFQHASLNTHTHTKYITTTKETTVFPLNYLISSPIHTISSIKITTKPTPWRRSLTEILIDAQLVKKLPAFYGTQSFIMIFVRDHL